MIGSGAATLVLLAPQAYDGCTPLHLACAAGHTAAVEVMLVRT